MSVVLGNGGVGDPNPHNAAPLKRLHANKSDILFYSDYESARGHARHGAVVWFYFSGSRELPMSIVCVCVCVCVYVCVCE